MIVTVTPAPAIDWTVEVESFQLGAVNRVVRSSREPSGKGVNISWALHLAGLATRAVFPAGGITGLLMDEALTHAGVDHVVVETGRDMRINITMITPGSSTKINEAGVAISEEHVAQLRDAVVSASGDATAVLICGSLPVGVPATFVRDLVDLIHGAAAEVVVDSSGNALLRALEARPDLIKPNVHELAELTGLPITTLGDVVVAAQAARARGAGAVLASLGPDGALLVDDEGVLHARATEIPFVNSVGAGDALLAGFFGGGTTRRERLAMAVLWASSAVAQSTTLFPVRHEFAERISVSEPTTPNRLLSEPAVALVRVQP